MIFIKIKIIKPAIIDMIIIIGEKAENLYFSFLYLIQLIIFTIVAIKIKYIYN